MVRHNCCGMTISSSGLKKRCKTSEGCVEMVIPWQLCWTIGPVTFHSQMFNLKQPNILTYSIMQHKLPTTLEDEPQI